MGRAQDRTREIGAEAVAALDPVPDGEAKAALVALVDGVIDRVG
jgi:heptaprenyl diphosphate synthase